MTTQESGLVGKQVVGDDGTEIGTVSQIVHAEGSGEPEWLVVKSGPFGMRERVLPYAGARGSGDTINVPMSRDLVKDSPQVDLENGLTSQDETTLVEYYDRGPHGALKSTTAKASTAATPMAAATTPRATATPQAGPRTSATGETARAPRQQEDTDRRRDEVEVTRYEERLSVSKQSEEAGRVRIRKVVEKEAYEQSVGVLTEDFEVIREPIENGRGERHELAADEQEMILYRERLMITKVVVPVERVRLRRKSAQTQQTVRETLAKERIEVEKADIPSQPAQQRTTAAQRR
ncbi:DUF2382 domain-containing protein [Actinomadura hibisca]|uniref:DUF2382 domain-containing protein n=1 Tax=Actinomadura hibisca TaxID=68565 RepID=UPI00082A24E8|nr:PRC and DUF2382 domain-containing protein [Actinomadura hibisca]